MLNCIKSSGLYLQKLRATAPNVDLFYQQTRNTYILKRAKFLGLHKKHEKSKMLKPKHFVYELVENTITRKKQPIDVILTQFVDGVGNAGDRITMNANRAYVNLLLPRLAVYASPRNIEKMAQTASSLSSSQVFSSPYVNQTMKLLSKFLLSVIMSKDVPWTLEKWHMHASFRKAGFHVPEEAITMPTKPIIGPNLEIQNKEFYVMVTINNKEQVKVRCRIHHWASEKSERITKPCFWEYKSTAIFPEDQAILDSLPRHALFVERKDQEEDELSE